MSSLRQPSLASTYSLYSFSFHQHRPWRDATSNSFLVHLSLGLVSLVALYIYL